MSDTLDLGQNYRLPGIPGLAGLAPTQAIAVDVAARGDVEPSFNPNTGAVTIKHPDGVIEIDFGGAGRSAKDTEFNGNLAEHLGEGELNAISEDLLRLIEQDDASRQEWLSNRERGIDLLGLQVKQPNTDTSPEGTISKVDHPLLLEACLRFQANARGELLPTGGPVKVRNDGPETERATRLADALEKDLNHYLTVVAKEYYPDTDKLLFMTGFGGISFKIGYHCPIKRRPVLESIDAKDLIVSNASTNLAGAGRITRVIHMGRSTLKRMQIAGAYRKISLGTANPTMPNPVDAKINEIQGIAPAMNLYPEKQEMDLYECFCELDISGFEHKDKGKETGLPIPYKVVIDRDSRKILEIRRNYEDGDPLCMPKQRIVAYIFVPGLGFYSIGLLNILGNMTKAVTAATREMLDAAMFASFPGFLYLKGVAKQLTNQFRVMPGTGMAVDSTVTDIRQGIMPLPYKQPGQEHMALIENIVQTGQRVGGTAELQVGEGKQDAPVGTTLALIEQATKVMSAVHKRLHEAQQDEFGILKELLSEDPGALWRHNKKSEVLKMLMAETGQSADAKAQDADEQKMHDLFIAALNDMELVPAADPNTASQTERYLKTSAMMQIIANDPAFNQVEGKLRALHVMGIEDAESLLLPAPPPGAAPPNPQLIAAQAAAQKAEAALIEAHTKAQTATTDAQTQLIRAKSAENIAVMGLQKEALIHQSDAQLQSQKIAADFAGRHADRQADLRKNALNIAADLHKDHHNRRQDTANQHLGMALDLHNATQDRAHDMHNATQDRAVDLHNSPLNQAQSNQHPQGTDDGNAPA